MSADYLNILFTGCILLLAVIPLYLTLTLIRVAQRYSQVISRLEQCRLNALASKNPIEADIYASLLRTLSYQKQP